MHVKLLILTSTLIFETSYCMQQPTLPGYCIYQMKTKQILQRDLSQAGFNYLAKGYEFTREIADTKLSYNKIAKIVYDAVRYQAYEVLHLRLVNQDIPIDEESVRNFILEDHYPVMQILLEDHPEGLATAEICFKQMHDSYSSLAQVSATKRAFKELPHSTDF